MNCLVIGGAGFIGAYVVKKLLAEGHEVVITDFSLAKNTIHLILTEEELARVKMYATDVTDFPKTLQVIEENKIDSLVHLAYWQIPASHNNPTQAIKVNGLGFNYSLEAMASLGLRRLVWTSSNAVFGSPKYQAIKRVPNDAFMKPNTAYGAFKVLNEYMAEHYHQHLGVDSIGFRFCLVYGYGRMRGASTFASDMVIKAAKGEPCVVDTGDTLVDWLYVEDAAHLIVEALKTKELPQRVYNVNSDVRTVREAAEYLMSVLPDAKLEVKPGSIDANWDLDSTLLEKDIGFKPKYSMEEGMRDFAAQVRINEGLPALDKIERIKHYK